MWKVVGAAVRGRSHERADIPCQDAVGWVTVDAGTCLAIADGAGSRPRSQHGSAEVVRSVLAYATDTLGTPEAKDPAGWMSAAFARARDDLETLAAAGGCAVDEFATTLAVALLTGEHLVVGQLGDGIVVVCDGGTYRTVSPPPRHEYANETEFLTGVTALSALRLDRQDIPPVTEVVMSTDGMRFQVLEDLAAYTPYAPFFADVGHQARTDGVGDDAVRAFLSALSDQSGDDKSLVIAVHLPERS